MKLLAFGDIHMATGQLDRIAQELKTADLVVLSGDLTNFGGSRAARTVIEGVRRYCATVLALPGNLDRPEVIEYLRGERISLHGENHRIGDLDLFGCGGSNPTPFRTPLEYEEEALQAILTQAHAQTTGAPVQILVCHTPPYATRVDRLTDGRPVGSPAVRRFISDIQPHLCITGHIHESAGTDRLGRTLILNAGAFAAGGYIVAYYEASTIRAELRFAA